MEEYKFLGGSTEFGESTVSVAVRFQRFMQEAKDHRGRLYEYLSGRIVEDWEMLRIATKTQRSPIPNTFFAAVHFLLLNNPKDPLGKYYGSITPQPLTSDSLLRPSNEGVFDKFKDFVMRHESELTDILKTGITQTNEVGRCAYLLPAFQTVYRLGKNLPLSLIDVGCSAGLHLLWNKYWYEYRGEGHDIARIGIRNSPVRIHCEVRGSNYPPVPMHFPPSVVHFGIDLDPIDLRIKFQRTWLESFVFPDYEHNGRRELLKSAMEMAVLTPPIIWAGDVLECLPKIVPKVPAESTLCIYHSHSMYQSNQDLWDQFESMLTSMSMKRDIFWIIAEGYELHLRYLHNGEIRSEKLANKAAHGSWLEWVKEEAVL